MCDFLSWLDSSLRFGRPACFRSQKQKWRLPWQLWFGFILNSRPSAANCSEALFAHFHIDTYCWVQTLTHFCSSLKFKWWKLKRAPLLLTEMVMADTGFLLLSLRIIPTVVFRGCATGVRACRSGYRPTESESERPAAVKASGIAQMWASASLQKGNWHSDPLQPHSPQPQSLNCTALFPAWGMWTGPWALSKGS